MSYILDALQRADAERERGQVPGLRSQIVPPPGNEPARRPGWRLGRRSAMLLVAGLGVLLALWWWLKQPPEAMPDPAAERAAPAVPPPPASEPPAPAQAAAPSTPVQPILAPPRPEPIPSAPPAKTATASATEPAPPAASAPAAAAAPVAVTPEPQPEAPVRSFAELSPEARAQLPAVNVSGSTYSKDPAARMLIVNGKVVQEGQEIAPGLKLETIGQGRAVLNHQGLRYSIGF